MKKAEKTFFVSNLTEELKSAKTAILVDYSGLSVKMQQELKKRLSSIGAKMLVVKNTLFKLAGEKAKLPKEVLDETALTGQTAIIFSEDDPIAPLSVLGKFALEFDTPQLKVGIVEGLFRDKEDLTRLSKLPKKELLVSQAVSAIAAPTYALINTLEANLQKLVFTLDAKSKSGGD